MKELRILAKQFITIQEDSKGVDRADSDLRALVMAIRGRAGYVGTLLIAELPAQPRGIEEGRLGAAHQLLRIAGMGIQTPQTPTTATLTGAIARIDHE